ncbi:enoyl-CoA hydratase/isomerase family protein [Sinimarinibacterium thermocellulolyticum]|uniref:Enoyl-CoA hydratase-related protein n=1 Tax=Sinimarinibacterium thermocellulolyticum TaxID=3170016 RepID=A0ABV2ABS4_9GAMM
MRWPETTTLLLRADDGVLHVTLNRPDARNALNALMIDELDAVFDAIAASREVRAVVLRGAGGHFCAGADLKEVIAGGLKAPAPGEADPIEAWSRRFGAMLRKAGQLPAVLIAVCEGAVLGGGLGFSCVSDIAFAQVDAKFGLPETTRGLPPAQIAPFVVERIGLTQARRLCLTGAQFRGREALALGLVHECFDDETELQTRLDASLEQILHCAPQANAVTKDIILKVARMDMDAVLDDAARQFARCVRGPEAPEGIAAFMQKRAPKWARGT